LSAPPAEQQVGKQNRTDGADDHWHGIGSHRTAGTHGLNRGGLGEDGALVPTVLGNLSGHFAGSMRILIGAATDEIGALMAAVIDHLMRGRSRDVASLPDEITALIAPVVGNLMSRRASDVAGLPGEVLQMLLRQVPRLNGLRLQAADDAAGLTIVDAVKPRHVTLP
jgi:hypothetical protein